MAQVLEGEVGGDAEEPAGGQLIALDVRKVPPRLQERILAEVVRGLLVARHAPEVAEDLLLMRAEEPLEAERLRGLRAGIARLLVQGLAPLGGPGQAYGNEAAQQLATRAAAAEIGMARAGDGHRRGAPLSPRRALASVSPFHTTLGGREGNIELGYGA